MKSVKINGVSVRVFEKRELSEKLKLTEEEIKLVMDYQKIFPELLQDGVEGFVIDARILWEKLGNPYVKYADWMTKKILKNKWKENTDYCTKSKIFDLVNNGYKELLNHYFTIDMAKNVSMMENSVEGELVRDYFITMEKTIRNYETWVGIREPQKAGNNEMKHLVNEDYKETHNTDSSPFYVFCNENDMLNLMLLGMKAKEVKELLAYDDKITREHFTSDINKALSELQMINSSLIISKMDFEQRKGIIKKTCDIKYIHIKTGFQDFIKKVNINY